MIEATKAVGIHHFIMTARSLRYCFNDDTLTLSVGRNSSQPLLDAPAVKDAPLLILDEATC